jgi:hypothetical protein
MLSAARAELGDARASRSTPKMFIHTMQRQGVLWKTFCSPLPASFSHRPHPPIRFVENKGQTPNRKACQKPVDPYFFRFSGLQSRSIFKPFSRFSCSVGRGSQRLWLADYSVLIAERFILSKTALQRQFHLELNILLLPFVRSMVNRKATWNSSEQAFMPEAKS